MKLRKKLVKAIAIATIGIMSMNSFAAELPVLTLEQAVRSAQGADSLQQEAYRKGVLSNAQVMQDTDDVDTSTYQRSYYSKLDGEQSAKYRKDAVAYRATSLYNTITLLQKQVAFCDEKLAYQENEFKQTELKYQKGLISKIEYETAQSKIEEQRTAKSKYQAQLDESKSSFKTLTNYDANYYTFEEHYDVEFYHFIGNIEYSFSTTIDEMLQYQEKLAEVSNNYIFSDMMKRGDNTAMSYYSGKASAAQAKSQVESQKDSYLAQLNSQYKTMVTLEQDIKELEVKLQDAEKNLVAQKLRYEKGLVSKMEIDKAEIGLKEQQLSLIQLKVNYNSAKDAVKKPWVNFY